MIDEIGGVLTAAEDIHIQVYVIDGVGYISAGDGSFEIKLNAEECRRLSNLLKRAERRLPEKWS